MHGLSHIQVSSEVCEEFLECKHTRNTFKQNVSTRSMDKFEVIYSDVCGPIQTKSLGGNRYFVSFIDDLTRKVWIYLIKRKSDVFDVFKKFKRMVEKQSGKHIKVLRTNGGGEYVSDVLQKFCEAEGIMHEVTPSYTPQHNGTDERKSRTITNMVRSILKSKKVPNYLWGETSSTTTHITNRSPTKRLSGKTQEQAWACTKSNVTHFRVFGSICFRCVPNQLRRKLDDKGQQMVLVAYHSTGGYKLYDPRHKQIVISRYVIDESKSWDWNTKSKKGSTKKLIDLNKAYEVKTSTSVVTGFRRSTRTKQISSTLHDFDVVSNSILNSKRELVHYALFSTSDSISFDEAMHKPKWVNTKKS